MKLSATEEELMNHLWYLKEAKINDLISLYKEPKPAITTIATLLKRMQNKNYVGYNQIGRARLYFPLVDKTNYFSKHINGLIKKYFNNSSTQFASFFTTETNLSKQELEALKEIINSELKKKK